MHRSAGIARGNGASSLSEHGRASSPICMYEYVYLHILRLHVCMFFTQASAVRMSVCLHICQPRICMLATRMCLCPDTNRSCSFAASPHSGCMNPGPVSKFGTSSALGQHRGVFVCVRASVSECVRACVSVSVFVCVCLFVYPICCQRFSASPNPLCTAFDTTAPEPQGEGGRGGGSEHA